jgi:3',5'-cyclic AMP phosphodiesterase CpdA
VSVIYWTADGAGAGVGNIPGLLHRWIVAQGDAALIINGGDVYDDGTDDEYALFAQQMDDNLSLICETPGNHDWATHTQSPQTGRIPSGYEKFWKAYAPPLSKQPIDATKKGGARYEHFIDLDGWRLIFLDTGPSESSAWPGGDVGRTAWLRQAVQSKPGRAKIVFAHHSRLSSGLHGDNPGVDAIWRELFDSAGAPLAACTVAGHDHNVSIYGPRPRSDPHSGSVPFAQGIYLMVNGASGVGHYAPHVGTTPDLFFNDDVFCVTRITLDNAQKARFDVLGFGATPDAHTMPQVIAGFAVEL